MKQVALVVVVALGCSESSSPIATVDENPRSPGVLRSSVDNDPGAAPATGPLPGVDRGGPYAGADIVTSSAPGAAEVAAMIARSYHRPALLAVRLRKDRHGRPGHDDVIHWERTFDGARSLADTITTTIDGAFHTRFYRELAEPAPIRRGELIGEAAAIAKSGFAEAEAELVFRPKYGQRQIPGNPGDNAMHWFYFIERSDLVYQVSDTHRDNRGDIVHLDAYTGAVVEKLSRRWH